METSPLKKQKIDRKISLVENI